MPANDKERIDILLVNKGFAQSREKAKSLLMAGLVFVDNQRIDKAGTKIPVDSDIVVKGSTNPFVSRGGLKLDKAVKNFDFPVSGRVFIDVGASTGGFTDCLLKNGAKAVIAIDVGYGQFAWELRNDDRVTLMERTNIRYVTKDDLKCEVDGAVIDVSFISLKLVLPVVLDLLSDDSHVVALIKPQFEAGKGRVGKNGVVKEASLHIEIISEVLSFAQNAGYKVLNLDYSPITGPEGNIEFLAHLYKGISGKGSLLPEFNSERITDTVLEAHKEL